eukprot:11174021-Lingulodinium_polyedra.AAC.1
MSGGPCQRAGESPEAMPAGERHVVDWEARVQRAIQSEHSRNWSRQHGEPDMLQAFEGMERMARERILVGCASPQ